ncbi:MAG: LysR family transcriptional regulator [Rhodospirillaceae bacterium]|jgi:DNA-binding transcriptional LysR family regulator|nr:LysR family transcriptional regulator [Rhodospirillaceae bacterium]MBT5512564.1 LysR family transcriptional regulator [Rhodospirillaceae bacterium]MBT6608479.1 LysR family transcriptional regulator [Rhodospirillaceae bacterium]
MEIAWLEDFVVLARLRHFSRAAEDRNVSQPAFSRRIQALEAWMGTRLINRRTTPVTLTAEGDRFRETAIGVLRDIYRDRDAFRRDFSKMHADVWISGSTAVLVHFVPDWLKTMAGKTGPFTSNISTYAAHNSVTPAEMVHRLRQGDIDFTFIYAHPDMPWILDTADFEWQVVGTTPFRPFSPVGADGRPLYELPGSEKEPLPWLAYATDSILARAEGLALQRSGAELNLQIKHQSAGVELLKRIALSGAGFCWFPNFAVRDEVEQGILQPIGNVSHEIDLEIRLYRGRGRTRPIVDKIWDEVCSSADQAA